MVHSCVLEPDSLILVACQVNFHTDFLSVGGKNTQRLLPVSASLCACLAFKLFNRRKCVQMLLGSQIRSHKIRKNTHREKERVKTLVC